MPDPARVGTHAVPVLRLASDRRLIEQVRGGSEPAFEVLFARYHPAVLAYCRRLLRSADEAEDAAQQTFVAAYRELAAGDAEIQLRPWLYAVARHRCFTTLRARRAQPLDEALEPVVDRLVGDVTTREDLRGILADVAGLPADQRQALVLAQLGDVPHAEIARRVGCSPAKVKALVFQAREALAAGRAARDTSCADIRIELTTARGAALRRAVLRRHLSGCADCRAFREAIRAERQGLRLVWPLAPLVALKRGLLAMFGTSATGGAGALSGSGIVAAALVTVSIPAAVVAQAAGQRSESREPGRQAARVAAAAPTAPAAVAVRGIERRTVAVVQRRPAATVERPEQGARRQATPEPQRPARHAPVPARTPHPPSAAPATVARPLTAPSPPQPHPAKPSAAPNGQARPRPANAAGSVERASPAPSGEAAGSRERASPAPSGEAAHPAGPPQSAGPPTSRPSAPAAPPAAANGKGPTAAPAPAPAATAPPGRPKDYPRGRP